MLINPSDEPYFNILSAMSNPNDLHVLDLRETSDDAFAAMAQRLTAAVMAEGGPQVCVCVGPEGGGSGSPHGGARAGVHGAVHGRARRLLVAGRVGRTSIHIRIG